MSDSQKSCLNCHRYLDRYQARDCNSFCSYTCVANYLCRKLCKEIPAGVYEIGVTVDTWSGVQECALEMTKKERKEEPKKKVKKTSRFDLMDME